MAPRCAPASVLVSSCAQPRLPNRMSTNKNRSLDLDGLLLGERAARLAILRCGLVAALHDAELGPQRRRVRREHDAENLGLARRRGVASWVVLDRERDAGAGGRCRQRGGAVVVHLDDQAACSHGSMTAGDAGRVPRTFVVLDAGLVEHVEEIRRELLLADRL